MDDFKTEPMPSAISPAAVTADPPPEPAQRAKQVTFWVLVVVAAAFWLLALTESRSIIGATAATLAVTLLYTVIVAVARYFDLGTLEQGVRWLIERGWRKPQRTFRLATADLRSAVHPSANGRARACPQQRLDFAPATLQALERLMPPKDMADLATDAFVKACQKRKAIFSDERPVQVVIGSDHRLGLGQWSHRYIPEGGIPELLRRPKVTTRPATAPGDPSPTQPYTDFEPTHSEPGPASPDSDPTRSELDSTGPELDPDSTRRESATDTTVSFPTLTLITDGDQRTVGAGAPVTIGRESTCDIVLPSPNKKIHRHHATLTYRPDGRWWLRPEGDHGVRVGGTHHGPGDETPLSDGDTIAWGRSPSARRSQVRIN